MKRTVFVLGAGASAVFDFPVGKALFAQVCQNLHSIKGRKSSLMKEFRTCISFSDEEIGDFCTQLQYSASTSVDAFLEHRTEFLDLGKAAMAFMLVRCESSDALWTFADANWLSFIFNRMNTPFEEFAATPISFITFNYDRSLEHFLHTSLQYKYRKDGKQCAAVLCKIPIIHLHGRLGYLPWQDDKGKGGAHTTPR